MIAVRSIRSETPGHTLGPTALVHEAYLRFHKAEKLNLNNTAHFLSLAARVMRRMLVDRARARRALKRGGPSGPAEYIDLVTTDQDADEILAVNRAMEVLSAKYPDAAEIVELRWFAGYSEDQCAQILALSPRTVRRRWQLARTRLKVLIDGFGSEAAG